MRAWSAIVASGPCLIVNLSAERGKQVLPNRQYLHRLPIHAEDGPPIRWWRVRGDDSAAELRRGHHARFRNSRAAFPAWPGGHRHTLIVGGGFGEALVLRSRMRGCITRRLRTVAHYNSGPTN